VKQVRRKLQVKRFLRSFDPSAESRYPVSCAKSIACRGFEGTTYKVAVEYAPKRLKLEARTGFSEKLAIPEKGLVRGAGGRKLSLLGTNLVCERPLQRF
jgi:hypothetical protein